MNCAWACFFYKPTDPEIAYSWPMKHQIKLMWPKHSLFALGMVSLLFQANHPANHLLGLVVYWQYWNDQISRSFCSNQKPYMHSCTAQWRDILSLIILIIFFISNAQKVCSMPKKPCRGQFVHHTSHMVQEPCPFLKCGLGYRSVRFEMTILSILEWF